MNISVLFRLLLIGILISSCKKELEPQESSAPLTPDATQTAAQPNTAQAQQPTVQPTAAPQVTSTVTGQPTAVAPGMNPPHGQPGHRCDIAVGAPLNSPPGKTGAKPAMTINPGQMTTTQTGTRITPAGTGATPAILAPNANTAVAATAPGMNPPHGQPGHRCDIAVGAPLNSPPKTEEKKAEPAKTDSQFTVSDPATEKKSE